jgi:hypothetical protein
MNNFSILMHIKEILEHDSKETKDKPQIDQQLNDIYDVFDLLTQIKIYFETREFSNDTLVVLKEKSLLRKILKLHKITVTTDCKAVYETTKTDTIITKMKTIK